jgi:hypothetical protein
MLAAFALLVHVGTFLCDSELHAIQFAQAGPVNDDMAADLVGRAAQRQVCGLFGGEALVVSKYRVTSGSELFLVTQYEFAKDHRTAFGAGRILDPGEAPQ